MKHRIFITGDKHGDFAQMTAKLERAEVTAGDTVIILGDHGTLFYNQSRDKINKNKLDRLPCSFILIRGNHDRRPTDPEYIHHFVKVHDPAFDGVFYQDNDYPKLFYTMESDLYRFGSKNVFVMGGAYSIDKFKRLNMQKLNINDYKWFSDEQLSQEERNHAKALLLQNADLAPFVIMTHTCPFKYKPYDKISEKIKMTDETMEHFFDDIEQSVDYEAWYCGHWHIDRSIDKMRFMYNDILLFDEVG